MTKARFQITFLKTSYYWFIAPQTIEVNYSIIQWASGWILQGKINK